jgi:glycosyltransferase involved in cell wall biosynthesis
MTRYLLDALGELQLLAGHLDTRDPQPVETIGALSTANLAIGLRHIFQLDRILRRKPSAYVLLPISQGTWGFLRDAVFVLVVRLHRRRLIIHLHGGGLDRFYAQSGRIMRLVIRTVFRHAHAAWALTPGLERMFDGLVAPSRVTHLENVTPPPPLNGDDDRSRNCSSADGSFRILYLANLFPDKGVFDLLEALSRIGPEASHWHVRIVGTGSAEVIASVRSTIDAFGSPGPAVDLTIGLYGEEKWAAYQAADAFVFPTCYPPEGQPLVVLEAMAAGLPVVSTLQGGIPDTVRHEREGLLVRQGNVDELARALVRLASDADLRHDLARAARARYEQRYTPDRLRRDLSCLLTDS